MAIEIVDIPIKNGDFPSFFVSLPEGYPPKLALQWRFCHRESMMIDHHWYPAIAVSGED